MKAAISTGYGATSHVRIIDLPQPAPKPGEVCIRVHASAVNSGDWRVQSGSFPLGFALMGRLALGWSRPRQPVLGTALSGVVDAVGPGVTRFQPGDAVLAFPGAKFGGHAEYLCLPDSAAMALKPPTMSFAEAAALPFGGTTALHFLQTLGKLQPGESVLVIGASGAVGSAAVSLACHFGAHVTAVTSAGNADLARQLGANQVIDYQTQDYRRLGRTWDVILDTTGPAPLRVYRRALTAKGRVLLVNTDLPHMITAALGNLFSARKARIGVAPERAGDLETLVTLFQTGAIAPLIDRILPFAQIRDAYDRVATGRKRGTVILDHMA
jgi:NADPH:quinone reductase-like Zn-dependent oxidoreductase